MESCVICGNPILPGKVTCSDECHEKFVYKCEQDFGVYKKVVDMTTGLAHKVPTRTIIEQGIKQGDLYKYPLWTEE